MYDIKEKLMGKKVSKVRWNKKDGIVAFHCNDTKEIFMFQTYGGCCSTTWLEQIVVNSQFNNAVVTEVQETSQNVPDLDHECLTVYVVTLINADGDKAKILFKNSSNGYYGGGLSDYYSETPPAMKTIEGGHVR